jgi:hypothetical protein
MGLDRRLDVLKVASDIFLRSRPYPNTLNRFESVPV